MLTCNETRSKVFQKSLIDPIDDDVAAAILLCPELPVAYTFSTTDLSIYLTNNATAILSEIISKFSCLFYVFAKFIVAAKVERFSR